MGVKPKGDWPGAMRLPWEGELPAQFGLRLAYPSAEAFDEFRAVRLASQALHGPWEPERSFDPAGEEMFRRLLAQANTETEQRLLSRDAETGRLVAYVSIQVVRPGPERSAYLGYWTAADAVNRRVGQRTVALSLDHAFGNLGLRRVEANVQPSNVASIGLVRRLGFRDEGTAKRLIRIAGEFRDHVRFAMLADEWPAKRALFAERLGELGM